MSDRDHQYVIIEWEDGEPVMIHIIDMPLYGDQFYRNQYSSIESFRKKVGEALQRHLDRGEKNPPKHFGAMSAMEFDQGINLSGWLNSKPQARYGNVNDFYAVFGYNRKMTRFPK
jgi:hypothetical protein